MKCFAFSTFATTQENFVSFRKFYKKFKTKMAEKHIFYEGLVAKFRAFLTKNTRVCKKSPLKYIQLCNSHLLPVILTSPWFECSRHFSRVTKSQKTVSKADFQYKKIGKTAFESRKMPILQRWCTWWTIWS